MKRSRFFGFLKFGLFGVLFVAGFGLGVMLLWNALIPDLFHGPVVSYLQAVGLVILARLLSGGHRGFHPSWRHEIWKRRFAEKWESMTPEEREKLRGSLRRHGPGRGFHHFHPDFDEDVKSESETGTKS